MIPDSLILRDTVGAGDMKNIRDIVTSTNFFNQEEIEVAVELAAERIEKGESCGYYFLFADLNGRTIGYACYGPISGTADSFDLYWIAVHDDFRSQGIGRWLLNAGEKAIQKMGGHRIYVETSSREQYNPTRGFYESCQYRTEAVLQDFYAPGDSKCIFVKIV